MRRIFAVLAVLLIAGALAGQAAACIPNRTNDHASYFNGGSYDAMTCENGVDANIYTTAPYVVHDSYGDSSAWDGIYLYDNTGTPVLGQVGWNTYWDSSANTTRQQAWWEINVDNQIYDTGPLTPYPSNGSTHEYKVFYSGGGFHFSYDGVTVKNYPYTLFGVGDSSCWTPTVRTEIHSYADQMPGISTNKQVFSHLGTRIGLNLFDYGNSSSTAWDTTGFPFGSGSGDLSSFPNGLSWISSGWQISTWDKCS